LKANTFQLNPLVLPVNATNKKVIYSTTNSAVATVNEAGLITGVGRGTAKISAKTEDGNFSALFTVSVYSNTLTLASLISNNMVLQQNTEVALWGWSSPNASVEISGSWGQTVTAVADVTGKWMKKIQTPAAVKGDNQPKYTLTFTGPVNTVTIQNILIGDVYLCSGQSNMLYPMNNVGPGGLGGVDNYATEILLANYPNIRYNKVDGNVQPVPVDYRSSSWTECNPTNAPAYSAVAYYFAKELYDDTKINIPIGLIVSAVGATRCQGWTSREAMASDPILKSTYLDPYDLNPTLVSSAVNSATILYNGGIAPLIPFTINGFLWYQGEGNAGETTYTRLFSAMINDWRTRWGLGNLPFYFVQIAPYSQAGANTGLTREQQTNTMVLPNTGMVVTTDITSDLTNIHPKNKKDVGKRLALWAKIKIYGEDIVYIGPMYKSMKVEGNKIRISFHPASIGSGLEVIGGGIALNEFSIGGVDNIMVAADAVIDGNDVLVSAASVPNPTNVWFAYKKDPLPNLRNKEGLPASPFRTNGWDNNIDISFNQISESQTPENQSIKISRMNETCIISGFPIGQTMRIYNLLGIEVYASKVTNENVSLSIPKGIYLLKELGSPFLVP
jgi:sialate O-acetylesterase